jgi:multiple sugar transport system substrate-binding protein
MKKLLAILMAISLILAFTACSENGSESGTSNQENTDSSGTEISSDSLEPEEGAEIEICYWLNNEPEGPAWQELFDSYTENTGVKIIGTEYVSGATYRDKLDTRIAAGDYPDVARYTYQRMGKFKEADLMLDITDYIPEENYSDLVSAYYYGMMYNGRLVGMPHHTDTIGIFYNVQMFEESNIEVPASPEEAWSWDEFNEIAQKLKADHNLEYAFAGIWEGGSGYRFLPFIYMNGGAVLNEAQDKVTFASNETLEALELYSYWRENDLVTKNGFTQESMCNEMFTTGRIAMAFAGSWQCDYMETNMPGNWGITYMPQVNGKSGSDMGGNGLFAFSNTEYPNASAHLIRHITEKDNMKAFCEATNFIPVRQSLLEEGLTFSAYQDQMDVLLEIVGTLDPKMTADETSTRFQQLNTVFTEAMDYIAIDGSKSAQEVMDTVQAGMEEVLAE